MRRSHPEKEEVTTHATDLLAGLDEVPWSKLTHAYGSAEDVPEVLRTVATGNAEAAAEAVDELFGNIFHQGTVYEATPHAVPFLARIADAGIETAAVLNLLGAIASSADYAHEDTVACRCREAVTSQVNLIVPLLHSPEDQVRAETAWTLAKCGPAQVVVSLMRARWDIEQTTSVRVALLQGLVALDPTQGIYLAGEVVNTGNTAERLVAALISVSAGQPWSTDLNNASLGWLEEKDLILDDGWWGSDFNEPFGELLLALSKRGDLVAATQLAITSLSQARISAPNIQQKVVFAVTELAENYRVPAAELVAPLARLLEDGNGTMRRSVLWLLSKIAASFPNDSARNSTLADTLYDVANIRGPNEDADAAVACLISLGDPRALGLLATDLVNRPRTLRSIDSFGYGGIKPIVGFDQGLFDAIKAALRTSSVMSPSSLGLFTELPERTISYSMLMNVLHLLATWGAQAAPGVPEIIRMLPSSAFSAKVLVSIGDPGPEAIAAVRDLCNSESSDLGSRVTAASALRDMTGETESLLAAIRDALEQGRELHAAAQAARSLNDPPDWLIPALRAALPTTGRHSFSPRAEIARALCYFTGDVSQLADLLQSSPLGGPTGGYVVLDAARDAGQVAEPLIPDLAKFLGSTCWCPPAAEAIMKAGLGGYTLTSLADYLVSAIGAGGRDNHERYTLDLLREIRLQDRTAISSDTLRRLRELAERPRRVACSGMPDRMIQNDEALRGMIRHFLAECESDGDM